MRMLMVVCLAVVTGCVSCPTRSSRQMGAMQMEAGDVPCPPFLYRGTSRGYHYFTCRRHSDDRYVLPFRIRESDVAVAEPFPLTSDPTRWRGYVAALGEGDAVRVLEEWKLTEEDLKYFNAESRRKNRRR